jgi:YD repeat-containing protein
LLFQFWTNVSRTNETCALSFLVIWVDRLTSQAGGIAYDYDYDQDGSTLDEKQNGTIIESFTYDVRNREIGAVVNGHAETYTYDDNGNRVETIDKSAQATQATKYEFDNASPLGYPEVLAEIDANNGTFIAAYAYGTERISETNGTGTHVYLYLCWSVVIIVATNRRFSDLIEVASVLSRVSVAFAPAK